MINIHNYIYHLYSIDVKNSRYMYMNFCIQHTFYIFYNLHLFYTFYTDLHQLPSNPIHGSSWRSRPLLWSWRRVVNPKCHSWRMLRRPCLWRSPSKRIAATVGGWGYRGGMGEEAPWFGKMKVIGYWNCRMGCFFLDWLDWLVYFCFCWSGIAVRFGFGGSTKYWVFLLNDGSGRQQMRFSLLNCHPSSWPLVVWTETLNYGLHFYCIHFSFFLKVASEYLSQLWTNQNGWFKNYEFQTTKILRLLWYLKLSFNL